MEYALIKSGTVENVIVADDAFVAGIVADEAFIAAIASEWDHIERIDTPAERALGVGIGWGWDGSSFVAPTPTTPEPQPVPAWERLIDIGPFFDRFGAAKMAVLASSDAGVQAIIKDTQVRKWLDLKHPDAASSIAYIGTKVPALTAELQSAILNTPVEEKENLALRKLYFS